MTLPDRRLTIPSTGVTSGAPLSFAQQRLWFLDQLTPNSAAYNISLVIELEGPLDVAAWERAVQEIVRRHDALRTTFPSRRGLPQQHVQPAGAFALDVEDVAALTAEQGDAAIEALIVAETRRPFDLARGPIFRARLLRLAPDRHVFVGAVHHIVYDAWSNGIFFRELTTLYRAFSAGEPSPLLEPTTRFVDFAIWQRERMQGDTLQRELSYWKTHLGEPPRLQWPADFRRPAAQTDEGAREYLLLPEELIAEVEAFSRREGVTLFITLLSAFSVLLHRFCRQDEMVIGTPIANRTAQELEAIIGFFLNTLPLRVDLGNRPTFRALQQTVKAVAFGAYGHQQLPFEKLVEELRPDRSLARGPLIDTVFVLDNNPRAVGGTERVGDLILRRRVIDTGTSKFDLGLLLFKRDGGRRATLEYRTDLFKPATAAGLLQRYRRLLDSILVDPDLPIDRLPLLTDAETARVLAASTGAAIPYPREHAIAQLFEREAARAPGATAIVDADGELTYDELNRRANRLAFHLRDNGVGHGDVVGVYLERSRDAIVALLAVLKSGSAYLPLDPGSPPERTAKLIAHAGVRTVVTRRSLTADGFSQRVRAVLIDGESGEIAERSDRNPDLSCDAASRAYVLFTSGSSGEPKAVEVPHRAIVRLAYGMPEIPLGPGARVLHAAPLAFDASTFEIWAPLVHGGTVVLAANDLFTPRELERVITTHDVTVLWLTASLFNVIVDERPEALAHARYVITGGEALSVSHVERALALLPSTTLVNGYGPTEAITFSTYHLIPRDVRRCPSIPIGRPLANTRVYVLDANKQPMPEGFPGEIWIGGDGLADGYLGDSTLTAERFQPDPFAPPGRMYHTGDLGRFLQDGTLEFLGRNDAQVKIRGFRVEPAEIENVLMQHPLVERAAIAAHERPGVGRTLVAYIVSRDPRATSGEDLRAYLRARLPEHMVPQYYELMAALPLLASGKIDRRALEPPAFGRTPVPAEKDDRPLTPTEALIAAIWKDRLRVAEIGRDSNFFALGGDSLLAVQIVSRLAEVIDAPLVVRSIFEFPTVGGLAKVIDRQRGAAAATPPRDPLPVRASAAAADRGGKPSASNDGAPWRVVQSELEMTLAEIWRHLLGVAALDIDDDFFSLGGHSLLAVQLAAEIESRFAISLPITALLEHRTIRHQAQHLADRLSQSDEGVEWSPLVALQPKGARPPLFLVHAIGGEVLSYLTLARHLGDDQPTYGIRARTEQGPGWCTSVEEIAASYVQAVKRAATGPYYIGGYSGGGLIAYEMAQQLLRAGDKVALLAMIDCSAPRPSRKDWVTPYSIAHLVKNTAYWLQDDDFFRDGRAMAVARLKSRLLRERDRLRAALRRGPAEADVRHALGLWAFPDGSRDFLAALRRTLTSYVPKPYEGVVTVIRSRTRRLGSLTPPREDLGWGHLADAVRARMVPGAHDTIMREPRVRELAAVLTPLLAAATTPPRR
jgi:amino acid adenylation domain-containing protein